MNERLRLLQSEIQSDLDDIAEAFRRLREFADQVHDLEKAIVAGYYLHVTYGLFEGMFRRIAIIFGNQVRDESRWHAQLLRRMTLDVPEVRPAVISDELHRSLDELRRFRHLFRNAYVMTFDPERLEIALRHARQVEALHRDDLERFLDFLDALADSVDS